MNVCSVRQSQETLYANCFQVLNAKFLLYLEIVFITYHVCYKQKKTFIRCKNNDADATLSVSTFFLSPPALFSPLNRRYEFTSNDAPSHNLIQAHTLWLYCSACYRTYGRSIMFNNSVLAHMRDVLTQFFPLRFFIHWIFCSPHVHLCAYALSRDTRRAKREHGMGGGIGGSNVSNYGSVDCHSYSFWAMGEHKKVKPMLACQHSSFSWRTILPSVFLFRIHYDYIFYRVPFLTLLKLVFPHRTWIFISASPIYSVQKMHNCDDTLIYVNASNADDKKLFMCGHAVTANIFACTR